MSYVTLYEQEKGQKPAPVTVPQPITVLDSNGKLTVIYITR